MRKIIKVSGDCVLAPELLAFWEKEKPCVLIVGGGTLISRYLEGRGIKTEYRDGKRVTVQEAIPVIDELLTWQAEAVAKLIGWNKMDVTPGWEVIEGDRLMDYGWVGDPKVFSCDGVPGLLTPMCRDKNWNKLNVNGDDMAAFMAKTLNLPIATVTLEGRKKEGEVVYCKR